MFQPLTQRSFRTMKIAARKNLFQGSGAGGNAIEFDGCARGIARDFERLSGQEVWEAKRDCREE